MPTEPQEARALIRDVLVSRNMPALGQLLFEITMEWSVEGTNDPDLPEAITREEVMRLDHAGRHWWLEERCQCDPATTGTES